MPRPQTGRRVGWREVRRPRRGPLRRQRWGSEDQGPAPGSAGEALSGGGGAVVAAPHSAGRGPAGCRHHSAGDRRGEPSPALKHRTTSASARGARAPASVNFSGTQWDGEALPCPTRRGLTARTGGAPSWSAAGTSQRPVAGPREAPRRGAALRWVWRSPRALGPSVQAAGTDGLEERSPRARTHGPTSAARPGAQESAHAPARHRAPASGRSPGGSSPGVAGVVVLRVELPELLPREVWDAQRGAARHGRVRVVGEQLVLQVL